MEDTLRIGSPRCTNRPVGSNILMDEGHLVIVDIDIGNYHTSGARWLIGARGRGMSAPTNGLPQLARLNPLPKLEGVEQAAQMPVLQTVGRRVPRRAYHA